MEPRLVSLPDLARALYLDHEIHHCGNDRALVTDEWNNNVRTQRPWLTMARRVLKEAGK